MPFKFLFEFSNVFCLLFSGEIWCESEINSNLLLKLKFHLFFKYKPVKMLYPKMLNKNAIDKNSCNGQAQGKWRNLKAFCRKAMSTETRLITSLSEKEFFGLLY